LGLSARLIAGDAADPRAWWDGRPFDHLLVDAPCTASGIGRRVPEARWLRRRGDLATQAAAQTRILEGLWPLLRPGGTLLFITCSVFDAEGPAVVERFLRARPDARLLPVSPMSSVSVLCEPARAGAGPGIHLLPVAESLRDHDGFFYCLIGKRA
jgi:16S rRNA (cytosine967-C5)-methyltransferase